MKTTTTTKPHPQRAPPGNSDKIQVHISWKLLLIKDARVHYVVLKQQPHTTHPTHAERVCSMQPGNQKQTKPTPPTPRHAPHKRGPAEDADAMALLPQDPTVCQTLNRTYPPRHRSKTTSEDMNPYLTPGKTQRPLFADIPPVSTRRRTSVCATGVLLTTPPHGHAPGRVVVGAP